MNASFVFETAKINIEPVPRASFSVCHLTLFRTCELIEKESDHKSYVVMLSIT